VSHLHSLQSYTSVTTITYYTLTRLHWLTSQLSVTFANYHRLYIFTRRNSRRELTPRIHFLRLLLNNWLVGLLLTNWLLRHSSSSYITLNRTSGTVAWKGCLRSVSGQRARWGLCYVTRGNAKVTRYSPTPVAGWRHRGMLRRNRIPNTVAWRHRICEEILFTGWCLETSCVTQQWVDMSQYNIVLDF
jgi:hypothetical protein